MPNKMSPRRSSRRIRVVNYTEPDDDDDESYVPSCSRSRSRSRSTSPPEPQPQRVPDHLNAVATIMEANVAQANWDEGLPQSVAKVNPTYASSKAKRQRTSSANYTKTPKPGSNIHGAKGLFTYDSDSSDRRSSQERAPPSPVKAKCGHLRTPKAVETLLSTVEGYELPPSPQWNEEMLKPSSPTAPFDPVHITSAIVTVARSMHAATPPIGVDGLVGSNVVVHDAEGSTYLVSLHDAFRKIAQWVASVDAMKEEIAELRERDARREAELRELKEVVHTIVDRQKITKERANSDEEEEEKAGTIQDPRSGESETSVERKKRAREDSDEGAPAPKRQCAPVKCDKCDKIFDTKRKRRDHRYRVHSKNETLVCTHQGCQYSTHRSDAMKRHRNLCH